MMQQFKTGLSNSRVKRICKQGERYSGPLTLSMGGFGRSSIPYAEFENERGSTSEEVKVDPMISKSGGEREREREEFFSFEFPRFCLDTEFSQPTSVAMR
ncbi:hypothetical protein TNCV_3257031 [Trichonephila clavipes]|nr:hypothetical protein TNCV_3257031 [Trichonephila clavipes]